MNVQLELLDLHASAQAPRKCAVCVKLACPDRSCKQACDYALQQPSCLQTMPFSESRSCRSFENIFQLITWSRGLIEGQAWEQSQVAKRIWQLGRHYGQQVIEHMHVMANWMFCWAAAWVGKQAGQIGAAITWWDV